MTTMTSRGGLGERRPLDLRWFGLFVAVQIAAIGVYLWYPGSWAWGAALGAVAVAYLVALPLWPWLIVPAVIATTALDITGQVIKETAIGIPVTGFHLALALALYSVAANACVRRRMEFPRFELAVPLFAFLGLVAISLTWSPNQPEATISFMRLLVLTLFLYLTQVMVDSRKAIGMTVGAMAAAMIGGATLGIIQILTEEFWLPATFVIAVGANAPRATGTFHNPNTFGTFMMVGVVYLTGVFALVDLKKYQRLFVGIGLAAAVAGLAVTFSRSNWLAAMIGVSVILAAAGRLKHFTATAVVLVLAAFAVKEFVPFADYIFTRFVSIFTFFQEFESIGRVSSSARIYFVQAGLGMFLDHPLFGAGWRAFPVILDAYKPPDFPHWIPTRESHTLFATVIAELGMMGLVAAGAIVFVTLRRGVRALRATVDPFYKGMLTSLVAAFVAFQVSLSFTADYGNNFLYFFTGVLFAVAQLSERDGRTANPQPEGG
jgi:O-antigen ligase